MAKHIVKCMVCGEQFDANIIEWVWFGNGQRRYAHKSCSKDGNDIPLPVKVKPPKKKEETPPPPPDPFAAELKELKDYINEKYREKANWPLIMQQIKKFHDSGKTYSGMKKALQWFYDIKKNSIEGCNGGIGIIEFCYNDSYQYFYDIWLAQNQTANKVLEIKTQEITIKPPKSRGTKNKLLDWSLDDEE